MKSARITGTLQIRDLRFNGPHSRDESLRRRFRHRTAHPVMSDHRKQEVEEPLKWVKPRYRPTYCSSVVHGVFIAADDMTLVVTILPDMMQSLKIPVNDITRASCSSSHS